MSLKYFAVGAACGALAYAGISAVLTDDGGPADRPGPTGASGRSDVVRPRLESERDRAPLPRSESPEVTDDRGSTSAPESLATSIGPAPASAPARSAPGVRAEPSESAATAPSASTEPLAPASTERLAPASTEALEPVPTDEPFFAPRWVELVREPKDVGWAYYMEQALVQFLASHPAMSDFTLRYIECRSTKCQVAVVGYDASTQPTWQRVIYDLRQQPWYEFGVVGSSFGDHDGQLVILTELNRA